MKTRYRILSAGAIAVSSTLLLASRECRAEDLLARKIFSTDAGALSGLAYDEATNRLYTVESASTVVPPQLRTYSLDGTLVSGPHALDQTVGSLTKLGLHFLRRDASIGGETVPAGTLTFLRGTRGALNPDVTLYALDKTDGSVLASEAVDPDFETGGLCKKPLVSGGKGLGYSTRLDRFLSTHSLNNCSGVALFSGGQVTDFISVSVPASSGAGDVKEHPLTGDIWVGNAPDINSFSVFSQEGVLLKEFDVFDAETSRSVGIMRFAFDASGERLWLLASFDGEVYEIDVPVVSEPVPVPAMSAWGSLLLALAFGGSALHLLARRERLHCA